MKRAGLCPSAARLRFVTPRPIAAPATAMVRLWWRFAGLLICMGMATLLAGGAWIENTLSRAEHDAWTARFSLAVERTVQAAESALALGVPLQANGTLTDLLAREAAALAPELRSLRIEATGNRVLTGAAVTQPDNGATAMVEAPIRNDLGQNVAWVRLRHDATVLHRARAELHWAVTQAVWPGLLWILALPGALCAVLMARLRRGAPALRLFGGERNLLAGSAALSLGMALLWLGWQASLAGQASIAPARQAQARALAQSSAALLERALWAGVPVDGIVGLPAHAAALRQRDAQVLGLSLLAPDGALLAGSATTPEATIVSTPVHNPDGAIAARLLLTLDPGALNRELQARLLDVAFLGILCLLLALEWMQLGLGARGARALEVSQAWRNRHGPARWSAARWRLSAAARVRPTLFLFMLAEEFTRPFLPTWARTLAPPDWGLSAELLASAPLVLFLAIVALLQWPLAAWSQRAGRRDGMMLGALLGAFAMGAAALLPGYPALLAARMLGALGFAMVFVAAQGAVIDGSSAQDRARSLGQFVRTILVAGLCGPPLGGLVADHWGVPAAFGMAAGACVLAAIAAFWQAPGRGAVPVSAPDQVARVEPLRHSGALRDSGLLPLLLGCALPAKLLLAAFCFYLLPMHLQDAGHGSAVIGRLQTIYPLAMVLLVPLAARAADRWQCRKAFVLLGGLVAGASAALAWPAGDAPLALAGVLLGLGVGQALSITPQSALVADLAQRRGGRHQAAVLGLFRITERGGSALGPMVGALLLPIAGFGPALASIGALVVAGSVAYGLGTVRRFRAPADDRV